MRHRWSHCENGRAPELRRALRWVNRSRNLEVWKDSNHRKDPDWSSSELLRPSVAVGTGLATHPPHRSQRVELPHWAPTSGSDAQPHSWEWMQDSGFGKPVVGDALHSFPGQPVPLTPPSQRAKPKARKLVPKCLHWCRSSWHRVVSVVPVRDTLQPSTYLAERVVHPLS